MNSSGPRDGYDGKVLPVMVLGGDLRGGARRWSRYIIGVFKVKKQAAELGVALGEMGGKYSCV